MRGSAALRTGITPGGALAGPWVRNPLWTAARAVPSLDLRFADNKSLTDATTGRNLVTFTRASSGTYVDSQGVIRTATTNLLLRSEEFDNAVWLKTASSVNADVEVAPNGTLTADKLVEDTATSAHQLAVNLSFNYVSGTAYTLSCYIKAAGRSKFLLAWRSDWFPPDSSATADLLSGTISTGVNATGTIAAVGNGWYRISVTSTADATGSSPSDLFLSLVDNVGSANYTGDGTSGIFIWGAQLEASSAVGEYVPTTSTINSAPRFDHNPTTGESLGLLVEEQRTNSIRNNTMVGAVAGTPGTLPTNWVSATPGGLTREIVGIGTQNGISYLDVRYYGTPTSTAFFNIQFEASTSVAAAVNQTWTTSVWVALVAGSLTNIVNFGIGFLERDSGGAGLTSGVGTAFTPTSEFNRQTYTRTLSNSLTAFYSTNIRMSFSNTTVPVDLTFRIGLPQLEQGAFATSVIPTTGTTATRSADVASITGSNFGVSRTNLLLRSEEFDNASWTKVNTTVSSNAASAPDGTTTADKLITDSGIVSTSAHIRQTVSKAATATTYTLTVFAKTGDTGTGTLQLLAVDAATTANSATSSFSTVSGTISIAASSQGTFANASSTITPFDNGWYRCSLTFTSGTETSIQLRLYSRLPTTGDGTRGLLIWGAQLETGSAATAYIPTTSAAVTVVDSPWYRQDEGTVFAEWIKNGSANFQATAALSDGTSNNLIALTHGSGAPTNNARFDVNSAGVSQASLVLVVGSAVGVSYRTVGTYKVNDFAASVNGASAIGDTSGSVPSIFQLTVGANSGAGFLNGTIRRLAYWPQRLSNPTLQSITQ